MSDLTAQLRLQFGVEPAPITFSLEVDQLDEMLNQPINVEQVMVANWFWEEEKFDQFYRGRDILKVISNGYTHVRLYSPLNYGVELFATELPVAIRERNRFQLNPSAYKGTEGFLAAQRDAAMLNRAVFNFEDLTKLPFAVPVRISPPQPAPPSVEFVGIKESAVLDTIEFHNQRTGVMKYNYVKDGFEIAYMSSFVTADGRTIEKPRWVPDLNGMFVLKEPAYGAMVIRYPVKYRLYKVNYGIPSGIEYPRVQLAWLRGDVTKFPMPPVTVIAVSPNRGRASQANFDKQIYPAGATPVIFEMRFDDDETTEPRSQFVENSNQRETDQVRVEDPNNPENFIMVQRARKIVLYSPDGRPYTYYLNP